MSKSLLLRSAAMLMIGTGAALAQATAPATAPKAGATTMPAAPAAQPAPSAQAPAAVAPAAASKAAAPVPAAAQARKVNLNTATQQELESLNQIGTARAKDIIEARAKGKFKNWDDFIKRNVVPSNAEAAIKDAVAF